MRASAVICSATTNKDLWRDDEVELLHLRMAEANESGTAAGSVADANESGAAAGSKRKADGGQPSPEKRRRRFVPAPSADVRARISRAKTQRMYLIAQDEDGGSETELARRFRVLGSTGNVYCVEISGEPACDCPDGAKGNLCKHILFVLLRVLRVPEGSPLVFQRALLQSELQEIFENAPLAQQAAMASASVRRAFAAANGGSAADEAQPEERTLTADDDCPICFEALLGADELVRCVGQCRNALHKDCFEKWERAKRRDGEPVTCPFCRSAWPSTTSPAVNEGYLNLAAEAGLDPERDGSSYIYGLSRRRYGYGW